MRFIFAHDGTPLPERLNLLPFYGAIVIENLMALFLLPLAGTKEKAKQKENAVEEISSPAGGDQMLCLWIPQAFKKA